MQLSKYVSKFFAGFMDISYARLAKVAEMQRLRLFSGGDSRPGKSAADGTNYVSTLHKDSN
jgi:hypothetical protein